MKKKLLPIFAFITSIIFIAVDVYVLYKNLNSENTGVTPNRYGSLVILAVTAIFSILIMFKNNKALYVVYLILSFRTFNIFGIVHSCLEISNIQKKENLEIKEQIENNPIKDEKPKFDIYKNVIITDKYKYAFVSSIVLLIIYFLLYVRLLVYEAVINIDNILNWISPTRVFNSLGPGALAFILIYPIMIFAFLVLAVICLIPVPFFIFSIKINYDAVKKDPHSYYALRILGFINLTFINSICSFIIVDDIERQKKEFKKKQEDIEML